MRLLIPTTSGTRALPPGADAVWLGAARPGGMRSGCRVPATLTTSSGQRLRVKYPEGELKRFAFSDKPLSVYAGVVRFEAELLAPPDSRGPVALSGEVSYQACTDEQCFPPARIPLRASVEIR